MHDDIQQFLGEVGRRNGFRGMDPETVRHFATTFERLDVSVGVLPPDIVHDVVILGTAQAVITVHDPVGDDDWIQVSELRGGAALTAEPLRERLFPGVEPLRETIEVVRAGSVWRMRADALRRLDHDHPIQAGISPLREVLDPMRWAPDSMRDWLRAFVMLEWINRSADLQLLTPPQRLALARTAEVVRTSDTGDVLTTRDKRAEQLMLLGPGMTATVRRSGMEVQLLTGALLGWSAFSGDRSPSDSVVAKPGYMLTWSEPSLARRLLSLGPLAHPWMGRFCQERHRVYSFASSLMRGLGRTELLRDVPEHRLAPLLQGASAVTWRVGAPPPVPVGLQSGLCVITEGEVIAYHMLPDEHDGSVAMVRLEPFEAHRGCLPDDPPDMHQLDTLGQVEVADRLVALQTRATEEGTPADLHLLGEHLTALASNRWTARSPSRAVFVPTWRLNRILGTMMRPGVARVAGQTAIETQVRDTMRRIDATEGHFRDDLNLVWVTRGDGSPPDAADAELLAELGRFIAGDRASGGFGERSLLVELVPATDAAPAGTWTASTSRSSMVERGTLASRPDAALHDVIGLIRGRRSTANVLVWGEGFGARLEAAADTVLLVNHDPDMALTGWPRSRTPVQVANLVRVAKNHSQPPVTVRVHGLVEAGTPATGLAGRATLLGRWARALTHRRVGVALGGGGAWGWAHVALLEAMHARGVPVDVVSGASFGAVAGGLYALGGLPALTWALQHDGKLQLATNGSMLLGWPMQRLMDTLLDELSAWSETSGFPLGAERARLYRANLTAIRDPQTRSPALQLAQLPLPFYPVATELVTGSEAPIYRGTVGHGVLASGSLPPLFPTTRIPGSTFADGGLSRNVPANVLLLEGAAVIVGSNIVPPPFIRSPARVAKGTIRRTLGALNPVRRGVDAIVGAQTLFNQAGAVDTGMAPVLFQTEWNGNMFFQISRGDDIVEDTRGERVFWQAMNGLAVRWAAIEQPRRGLGPVASTTAQGPQDPVPT